MTFCDDIINDNFIILMSKHLFVIKEQLCQSFWQLVKAFWFEAKKIEAFRVKTLLRLFNAESKNSRSLQCETLLSRLTKEGRY